MAAQMILALTIIVGIHEFGHLVTGISTYTVSIFLSFKA